MKQPKPLGIGALLGLTSFGVGAAVWLYTFVLLIIPSEIADIVDGVPIGASHPHTKPAPDGASLGTTLFIGALVSITSSPFIGGISDGWAGGSDGAGAMTSCGKRLPFIIGGVAASTVAGVGLWMATSYWTYTLWFAAVQGCIATAMTAFNGLLYERVPPEQRGLASGVMGGSIAGGNMLGAVLGLVYTATGRMGTFAVVWGLLWLCTLVTVLFSGDADAVLARLPLVGGWLLRCRGQLSGRPIAAGKGAGAGGEGVAYSALRRRGKGAAQAGELSLADLEADLGFGESPSGLPALHQGAQLRMDDEDEEDGDGGADDEDLTWGDEDFGASPRRDTPTGEEGDDDIELGAAALDFSSSHGGLVGNGQRGAVDDEASLDDTVDDHRGALQAVAAVDTTVNTTAGRMSSAAQSNGHGRFERKVPLVCQWVPKWLEPAANFLSPFADENFGWAFVSRLFYQQAIYTVQTYLLYYIRDAIPLPPGLQPHVALSMVMLPLLCCALLSPILAGWVSDAAGGAKRRLLVSAGLLMVLVTAAMAAVRSWQVLPWLGALFGVGYGTFNALDFALAMDVLPGGRTHAAKDLGLWNLALALPMCLAAPVAGLLLDRFNTPGHTDGYSVLFAVASGYLVIGVACVLKVRALK